MRKCTIHEAYNAVDVKTGIAILYTNQKGLKQMMEGNSFYVWTHEHATINDVKLRVFEKDLAEDSEGNVYCVDGLDVMVVD
ncbi:hypothetical protein M5X02_32270 [Paenibacillus alvei]|uniref:hypothetical protein n=1 Tax=Paenibacillus alvei TaxID=44250 RepID=UPI0002893904|nr:hypothetical protein [Paenibacillus alvei]EJW13949.1 hypothetical protein PAV_141p00550 [Paenibacillus alvei DSM 29]MCY9545305.1 hypothetical protein [Paenibacillus alvei]MCY9707689.1 hypothetical protein [Paenibacillus alvei]MEC0082798.1 hypothetical protein [Paenibacillus alvei]